MTAQTEGVGLLRHGARGILDYASGKARFARALALALPPALLSRVDYHAWDASHDEGHQERLNNVAMLCPGDDQPKRCSKDISDFHHQGKVDLVVACNFFHKAPTRDWLKHLRAIGDALRDDGMLVVMEDLEMPVGELPPSRRVHRDQPQGIANPPVELNGGPQARGGQPQAGGHDGHPASLGGRTVGSRPVA